VTAYPGQVTRVRAHFKKPGQFVWHCHIVEHEDNEMMRPFRIGPEQDGQPGSMPPV
jgi:FtsP/CotA-like multicopper oxidase with cupredoxin domain